MHHYKSDYDFLFIFISYVKYVIQGLLNNALVAIETSTIRHNMYLVFV